MHTGIFINELRAYQTNEPIQLQLHSYGNAAGVI